MTATFKPLVFSGFAGTNPFSLDQSATKRSSFPMEIGSPLMPRIHFPSHWLSWGHTRPQTAGSALDSAMVLAASSNLPSFTSAMNLGILIATGHPWMHFAFLQLMQRCASAWASSWLYPRHTSSKLAALTFGSCSLTGIFFNTSIIPHLRNFRIRRGVLRPRAALK